MSGKVSEEELEKQKYITLEDGTTLSDDFYKLYAKKPYQGDWKVPTDILYGSRDDLVFIESIVTFLEEHPLSKLTIRKDSEHYIHSEEEKNFIKDWILSSL
jgi:pimeloyl-ACP methyl ester carboxylesterase